MFIGEAPGEKEDEEGKPFRGRSGDFLDRVLEETGLGREKIYVTSSVKCRPPANRDPRQDELETCRKAWLDRQINIIDPRLIVLLGRIALRQVLGETGPLGHFHGQTVERNGRRVLPTYHPAAGMRFPGVARRMRNDFRKVLRGVRSPEEPGPGG